jgi:hypothetical protein
VIILSGYSNFGAQAAETGRLAACAPQHIYNARTLLVVPPC